jgi:hypothetical protein
MVPWYDDIIKYDTKININFLLKNSVFQKKDVFIYMQRQMALLNIN